MEPLVHTLRCPNCDEAILAFLGETGSQCEACGFDAEVFSDRATAIGRYESYLSDAEVIVTDPIRLGNTKRYVIAHTRMMLV